MATEIIETKYVATGNHKEFIDSLTNKQEKYVKTTKKASTQSKIFNNNIAKIGTAAIAAKAISAVVKQTIQFEKEMSNVKALLKPTSKEFAELTKQARELGKTTAFSAMQSAEAFAELGKLGFDTNQVIAASADVLNLAAAANTNMATAAAVTAKTINQFGLEAKEAARVTDVIAKASSSSAVDIFNFQEAMKLTGATAKGMGVSLEEATAAISVLANGGIEGTLAGTGLSRVLLELGDSGSKVSKILKTVAPDAETLSEKLDALKKAGLTTTQIFDAFGKIAGKSALTLINNAESVDTLNKSYEDAALSAKEMADIQLDNLDGDIRLLQSAASELAISMGDAFGPLMRGSIQLTTTAIAALTKFNLVGAIGGAIEFSKSRKEWDKSSESLSVIASELFEIQALQAKSKGSKGVAGYSQENEDLLKNRIALVNSLVEGSAKLKKNEKGLFELEGKGLSEIIDMSSKLQLQEAEAAKEKEDAGISAIIQKQKEADAIVAIAEASKKELASIAEKEKLAKTREKALKRLREITISQMGVEDQAAAKIKENYREILANVTLTASERKNVETAMANDLVTSGEDLAAKQAEINRTLQTALLSDEDAKVQGVKDKWSGLLDEAETTASQRVEVERQMQEEIKEVQDEFAEKRKEAKNTELEEDRERRAIGFGYAESATTAISGLVNAGFTNKQNIMNAETKAEITAVKKSTKTQDEKATAIAKIEDKAAKKSHELKLKEWRSSLLMSVANTALGVTKTMATMGYPIGLPFAAAVLATGIASTATIASNKPRLATGSRNAFGESSVIGNLSGIGGTDSQLINVSPEEMIIAPKDVPAVQNALNGGGNSQQAPMQTIQHITHYNIAPQSLDPRTSSEMVMESIYEAQRNNAVDKTQVDIEAK